MRRSQFDDDVASHKAKLEAQLAKLKPGPQMDVLRKKIRQLDAEAHITRWLASPGLRAPTAD